MAPDDPEKECALNYSKHITYWRRNLKTLLPHYYTSNDSNRMTLASFILSAADILGDLDDALSTQERQDFVEWVYQCQLPEGGFRPSPATDLGTERNDANAVWDPAHVAGTFFALVVLALLGDDLTRVKRRETLLWLTKMQRPDGSFGETLGQDGRIEGGNDTRFGYMSTGIRWILRGNVEGPVDGVPDIDVDKFVQRIRESETYDGSFSEAPFHEAHAGFACCAISALSLVDRLPLPPSQTPDDRVRGVRDLSLFLRWLASRQTLELSEDSDDDVVQTVGYGANPPATSPGSDSFVKLKSYPEEQDRRAPTERPDPHPQLRCVGMNGRCNKIGDTCYGYWVCAPLKILGHLDVVNIKPIRRWLLEQTQHIVGGFGKFPGDPPDLYHSYLGLVTLSLFGEPGLKEVDVALCVSNRAKEHLESLPWRKAIIERNS